ncbi:hypothetical protein AB838_15845 [Rhodobacteraceae bacterium (ex Bugula neritina AB1)]|nr:hypothetical protein AB838_15845 [Rhodobacteraceae bacterium (ex Bugula neritina AB1)]
MNLILDIAGPFPARRAVWHPIAHGAFGEMKERTWPGLSFSPAQYGHFSQQVALIFGGEMDPFSMQKAEIA